ncbi:DUF5518 domain-containing protein [Haladaptatus sp. R4]|uniref:DUF5518 domain-containing protein n=1 Tax=Haladaptatus sp. R4 TaxID=1679489 RepID=UPI000825EBA3|nr:DUF5518 domain-containing protein [Haladaptatus sp. R4]
MIASRTLRDLHDDRFRTAVLLGVASIPFTVGYNWLLSPDPVSVTPLAVACVLSGYRYGPRSIRGTRVGAVTGIVGGVPIAVWNAGIGLDEWWGNPVLVDAVGNSWLMAVISVAAAVVTLLITPIVLLFVGMACGFVGGWLHERLDPTRQRRSGA